MPWQLLRPWRPGRLALRSLAGGGALGPRSGPRGEARGRSRRSGPGESQSQASRGRTPAGRVPTQRKTWRRWAHPPPPRLLVPPVRATGPRTEAKPRRSVRGPLRAAPAPAPRSRYPRRLRGHRAAGRAPGGLEAAASLREARRRAGAPCLQPTQGLARGRRWESSAPKRDLSALSSGTGGRPELCRPS